MGYYRGNGVVSSGGSNVSVHEHFAWWGAHNVYQQHTVKSTRKSGVSLATAQAEQSECNMVTHRFSFTSGGVTNYHYSPNCKGTTKNVSYSQISGSHLYELVIDNDTIKAKLDEGGWVS